MEAFRGTSVGIKVLVWILILILTPILSRLMFELDWRYGNRSWPLLCILTSLLGAVILQILIWAALDYSLWIRIPVSVISATISVVLFFLVIYLGNVGGWRGVPAG